MSTNFEWQKQQVNERINDRLAEAQRSRQAKVPGGQQERQPLARLLTVRLALRTAAVILVLAAAAAQLF